MREYLTDEDYQIAEQNGIDGVNLYRRFYIYGWSKQRAVNTPIRTAQRKELLKRWGAVLTITKVDTERFVRRVTKEGWKPLDAATTVTGRRGRPSGGLMSKAVRKRAADNGINVGTLQRRLYVYKWDVERAVTEPINEYCRRKA